MTKGMMTAIWVVLTITLIQQANAQTASFYEGPELGLPNYTANDDRLVNVISGSISHSVPTVSIGTGANGLSHNISINANSALNYESYLHGYKEKFRGGIRTTKYSEISNPGSLIKFFVTRVFDHQGTYDFEYNEQNNTFTSLQNNQVQLLMVNSTTFHLIKADGTKVIFNGHVHATSKNVYAAMTQIVRPDGFTITIHREANNNGIGARIMSVTTNTGFQLKYVYEVHTRPLAASKQNSPNRPNMPSDSASWSAQFPSKIIALNNAVEVCPLTAPTCSPNKEWPTAHFSWPDGMPRAMYIGASEFSVTDAAGLTTRFYHFAQVIPFAGNNTENFIDRITLPSGQAFDYEYATTLTTVFPNVDKYGKRLYKSQKNGVYVSYSDRASIYSGGGETIGGSTNTQRGVIEVRYADERPNQGSDGQVISVPYYIETWDKEIHLTKDMANKVYKIDDKMVGSAQDFIYDTQGRLYEVLFNGASRKATYPSPCTAMNCQKALFTSNVIHPFNGFNTRTWTKTIHSNTTGQLTYIFHPANDDGVAPAVHYQYTNLTARYKNSAGAITNAPSSVSMLTEETYCENSTLSSTGCSGNDAVTIHYHYGTGSGANNLFLIASEFSSEQSTEVFISCFEYDKYGNQIGQSQPKSGISLSQCNAKRGF